MNLSRARLCLDCEEVHEDKTCPKCASEQWSLMGNWSAVGSTVRVVPAPPKRLPQRFAIDRATYSIHRLPDRIVDSFSF